MTSKLIQSHVEACNPLKAAKQQKMNQPTFAEDDASLAHAIDMPELAAALQGTNDLPKSLARDSSLTDLNINSTGSKDCKPEERAQ